MFVLSPAPSFDWHDHFIRMRVNTLFLFPRQVSSSKSRCLATEALRRRGKQSWQSHPEGGCSGRSQCFCQSPVRTTTSSCPSNFTAVGLYAGSVCWGRWVWRFRICNASNKRVQEGLWLVRLEQGGGTWDPVMDCFSYWTSSLLQSEWKTLYRAVKVK